MAVTAAEELDRVRHGPGAVAPPHEVDVLEAIGGERTLASVREVLEPVLEVAATGYEWPTVEEWKKLLPSWFVAACVDDAEVRDCVLDKWSLRAWTYWFQPGLRKWRWWDAKASGSRLSVSILVLQRPYLRGALEWLLQVCSR